MDPEIHGQRRLGRGMIALAWLALLGVLWLGFADVLERRANPNRHVVTSAGVAELVLQRNRAGHYLVPGTINGHSVEFLLDTGATLVSVPARLGAEIGLAPGAAQEVVTANGIVRARATVIDSLAFGPFELRRVRAQLNPGLTGRQVLLGMSVLRELEFTQRGDRLTLRWIEP